ncbi:hypothetical protein K2173_009220 [Erythroxylum novogranatense]|uniref:Uncharacterized protein n=1 Tax=Erythroxylum novogranatense TaxID=1862640 RepID=A0AAV8TKD3_9ROSI|nr:hypothetical protein K2173_009220 [Erythroxylum novogranatense]
MQILNLRANEFYGPVPESVCRLPNLMNLTLSDNYFTQVGPECRKLIKRKVIAIEKNCIAGVPNQRSYSECEAFFSRKVTCPNEKSLNYVPCKNVYVKSLESNDIKSTVAAPPPRSYDALLPHKFRL